MLGTFMNFMTMLRGCQFFARHNRHHVYTDTVATGSQSFYRIRTS
jgi:hypothetical protein